MEDHFNYPAANRNQTMYLSTLKSEETGFQKRTFYQDRNRNLDISDIDKARPYYHGVQFSRDTGFSNRNDDIAGSQPKKLHQPLQKTYYNLKNDDIYGSKPQSHKFVTTRLPSNPLNPEYKVSHVEIRVATPPKFIRDQLDVKDIDGARPNPENRYNIKRNTNFIHDIDGARPKKEWIPQGKPSSLDIKDINNVFEYKTKRETNPLSPRYRVTNQDNFTVDYGELDNKPMVRHPKNVNKATSSDLKTNDIDGAQAGSSNKHITNLATRNEVNKVTDIPGAQTGSLRKGMTSTRHLDPLWPAYTLPGHSEPAPVYAKNLRAASTTKYGQSTTSAFGATQNSVANEIAVAERKSSGQITPISHGASKNVRAEESIQFERKKANSLARTGEEILNTFDKSRDFAAKTEYVPARISAYEDKSNVKPLPKKIGFTLETKKALNSNETYQQDLKSFWGTSSANDRKGFKSFSTAEKFDKYLN